MENSDDQSSEAMDEPSNSDEVMEENASVEPETPRRVTRSTAKKSVTFAVDDNTTSELRSKRSAKRQSKPEEAISPEGQKKLGLVASKKTIMKKLRKSSKKSAKKASILSDMVDSLTM